jgi:uncharacterized protein
LRIAVILPTLNEAALLPATLAAIGRAAQIIVTDGGSLDATCAIARAHGADIVEGAPRRAAQLNAAVARTAADILLFLHADTLLPADWHEEVQRIMAQSNVVLGAFSLHIAGGGAAERIIAWAANRRSRYRQLPYGDQGLFIRRTDFLNIGGFPDVPIMDDYIFVKTLQNRGHIITSDFAVQTSNRRWRRLGSWRTTWRNQMVVLGYHLGVSLERLRDYYRS